MGGGGWLGWLTAVRTAPVDYDPARPFRSRAKPCLTGIVLTIYIQACRKVWYHVKPCRIAGLTSLGGRSSPSGQVLNVERWVIPYPI